MKILFGILIAISICSTAFASEYNCFVNGRAAKGILSQPDSGYVMLTINDGEPSEFNRTIAELNVDGSFKEYDRRDDEIHTQAVKGNKVLGNHYARGTTINVSIALKNKTNEISIVRVVQKNQGSLSSFEYCNF